MKKVIKNESYEMEWKEGRKEGKRKRRKEGTKQARRQASKLTF